MASERVMSMRFGCLHLNDFRSTRELRIDFENDVTVIVGRNGAGKTSILDALGMSIRFMLESQRKVQFSDTSNTHKPEDIRKGADVSSVALKIDLKTTQPKPLDVYSLSYTFDKNRDSLTLDQIIEVEKLLGSIDPRPRFIYYRQERGFASDDLVGAWDETADVLDSDAVQGRSLERKIHAIGDLDKWWDRRDAQEARMVRDKDPGYRDPQLEAIRNLVAKIDSFKGVSFSSTASSPGLHFVKNDGTEVHVGNLSSGERSYILLLSDLARRLQVFAPDKPLGEIHAIVLIDEIELNLHPSWQSEIVPTLARVFKACQFIVTTHSPQVLSGVESRQVRILDERASEATKVSTPLSTRGRTSNYLLEGVFAASERYPPIERMIEGFNSAVDRGDEATAARTLERIEEEIGEDAATILVLRKRLKKLRSDT